MPDRYYIFVQLLNKHFSPDRCEVLILTRKAGLQYLHIISIVQII